MRDKDSFLPLALVAVLVGGLAYWPARRGGGTASPSGAAAAAAPADAVVAQRPEWTVLAEYLGIDPESSLRRDALACGTRLVGSGTDDAAELLAKLTGIKHDTGPNVRARLMAELRVQQAFEGPGSCPGSKPEDAWEFVAGYVGARHDDLARERLVDLAPATPETEFLVATVPDPIDANARWQFDPVVSAIQSAAAASGYVLDRFEFQDWDSTTDASARRTRSTRHERYPSIILFRHQNPKEGQVDRLLVVLLAYETATTGVHEGALGRALRLAHLWRRRDEKSKPVRILGPSFSGSVDSLQRVIAPMLHRQDFAVRIVSGSATGPDNQARLQGLSKDTRVTYHATVWPDDVMLAHVLQTVYSTSFRNAIHWPQKIALLHETGSGWASGVDRVVKRFPEALQPAPVAASSWAIDNRFTRRLASVTAALSPLRQLSDDELDVTFIPFPLHISRLRSTESTTPVVATPGRVLPLVLQDHVTPTDTVPSFTPETTATATDLSLADALASLRRNGFSAIGILATDTRDKLFLAKRIAAYSPNVSLFTTEADLLLAHPDYRRFMGGMIVGSTYPLFSSVQGWTSTGRRRLQFESVAAQGTYNAALALLNYTVAGQPLTPDVPPLLDYAIPYASGSAYPAIWVTVVAREGLWPLRYAVPSRSPVLHPYQPPRNESAVEGAQLHPHLAGSSDPMSLWVIALMIMSTVLSVLHASVWLWRGEIRRLMDGRRVPAWRMLRDAAEADQAKDGREVYLLTSLLALVPVQAGCCVLLTLSLGGESNLPWFVAAAQRVLDSDVLFAERAGAALGLAGLLFVLLAFGALTAAVRDLMRNVWLLGGQSRFVRVAGAVAVVVSASAVVMGTGFAWFLLANPTMGRPFLYRAAHLANGISPALPIIVISVGLYLWSVAHLRRLTHPAVVRDVRNEAAYGTLAQGRFASLCDDIIGLTTHPVSQLALPVKIAVGCVVATVFVLVSLRGVSTVDAWPLTGFLICAWLVAEGLACLSLAYATDLWIRLRRLTRALAVDPIAPAFGRVPRMLFHDRFSPAYPHRDPVQQISVEAGALRAALRVPTATAQTTLGAPATLTVSDALGPVDAARTEEILEDMERPIACSDKRGSVVSGDWCRVVTGAGTLLAAFRRSPHRTRIADLMPGTTEEPLDRWCRAAEALVVLPVAQLVRETLARVVQGLLFATVGVLLLAAFLASVPVQSRQTMVGIAWFYIAVLSAVALTVFVQADRDELLSRLTGSPAGRINWDAAFLGKLLVYVALPLLTLFASQFPELTDVLGAWLAPMQAQLP